jgi:hypothetical protein
MDKLKVLHQTGCMMRLQQCMNQKGKAAFKMNKGLFEPTMMFFGMCNSLATFQAMMDDIFIMMIDN